MSNQYDSAIIPGARFGRLVFVQKVSGRKKPNGKTVGLSLCRCDCGKSVTILTSNLKNWSHKSCGCLKLELGVAVRTHGKSNTPEFKSWCSMRARCYIPSATGYSDYGGRGITVCQRWLASFDNFLSDMGEMPTPRHTIDRVNNDGNYEPNNCVWATKKEQLQNTRRSHKLTHNGETLTLSQWQDRTGISQKTIISRINKYGWSSEMALTVQPKNPYPRASA